MYLTSSLVFLNSDPLIDFPRVTTHKIVEIGGISLDKEHKAMNEVLHAPSPRIAVVT